MNVFEVIITTAKSKISPAEQKAKLWTDSTYVHDRLLVKLKTFFVKVFDVRPKNEKDYYTVGGWMVSKKLVFAISVLIVTFCGFYLWQTMPAKSDSDSNVKAYRYNSLALKFVSGKVEILGKSGYTAYIGEVQSGVVSGKGTLYRPDGSVVYTGEFDADKYNGTGTLYYENSNIKYEGAFVDNIYQGEGKEYREDGSLEYEGEFANDEKSGSGKLYDASGNLVYAGDFQTGEVRYSDFLEKTTAEAAEIYTGKKIVYQSDSDYCVYMQDIATVYCGQDGSDSLDGSWTVSDVYVLKPEITLEGKTCSKIEEIKNVLGEPVYEGNTNLTLTDEVALYAAVNGEKMDALFGAPTLTQTELYSDAYQIDDYEKDYIAYLYVFDKDGILYQFFCKDLEDGFSFYSIGR